MMGFPVEWILQQDDSGHQDVLLVEKVKARLDLGGHEIALPNNQEEEAHLCSIFPSGVPGINCPIGQ
jgi:hypothetical protein